MKRKRDRKVKKKKKKRNERKKNRREYKERSSIRLFYLNFYCMSVTNLFLTSFIRHLNFLHQLSLALCSTLLGLLQNSFNVSSHFYHLISPAFLLLKTGNSWIHSRCNWREVLRSELHIDINMPLLSKTSLICNNNEVPTAIAYKLVQPIVSFDFLIFLLSVFFLSSLISNYHRAFLLSQFPL